MSNSSDLPLRRAAARLRTGVFVTMALVLILYFAAELDLQIARAHVEHRLEGIGAPYSGVIGGGSVALMLAALFYLARMLGRIAGGETFSAAVVGYFRSFALWLLLMALFELIAPVAVGLATIGGTYPHRLRIAIDLGDLLTVGITLLLFLLAGLLDRARRLDEEMREFV